MKSVIKKMGIQATYVVPAVLIIGGIYVANKDKTTPSVSQQASKIKIIGEGMVLAGLVMVAFMLSKKD